ncbi:MAG: hypothetical protein AB7G13_23565, partial [Lautropia sp.]
MSPAPGRPKPGSRPPRGDRAKPEGAASIAAANAGGAGAGKFKVGLTRDLLSRDGEPSFGKGPLELLDFDPRIEWEYLPESVTEITPAIMARYDGLYVNTPKVTAASVAGP